MSIFTDVIRSRMKTQRCNHCSTKMVLKIMLLEMMIIKHENGSNKQGGTVCSSMQKGI